MDCDYLIVVAVFLKLTNEKQIYYYVCYVE